MSDAGSFLQAAMSFAAVARRFLDWMEEAAERLAPERSAALAAETERRFAADLARHGQALVVAAAPDELAAFATRLRDGLAHVERCFDLFTTFPKAPPTDRIPRILGALHELARAQETFYALRQILPPFHDSWPAPEGDGAPRTSEDDPPRGVVHVSRGGHHGGFSLYVPDDLARAVPVIVALHGGSGNGRDFLWTWLREARRRNYLLIAPSAVGSTWSEVEERGLREILEWVAHRVPIDRARVLLTGLSDGATFALLYGLLRPEVYCALAPACGVLHPANEALGNLERARGMPIYLVHGALDFLFPVALARLAAARLEGAGAALVYRELAELSHTYPRSENVRILDWFEALPPRAR